MTRIGAWALPQSSGWPAFFISAYLLTSRGIRRNWWCCCWQRPSGLSPACGTGGPARHSCCWGRSRCSADFDQDQRRGLVRPLVGNGPCFSRPAPSVVWTLLRIAASLAILALPTILMRSRFVDGFGTFCFMITAALLPCCWLAIVGVGPSEVRWKHVLLCGLGAATVASLTLGFALTHGNTLAGVFQALLIQPWRGFAGSSFGGPLALPRLTVYWSVLGAGLGLGAFWMGPRSRSVLWPLRLFVCALIFTDALVARSWDSQATWIALPLMWLVLVPPPEWEPQAKEWLFRLLLVFTTCLQPIQVFPVPGSQVHIGTVTAILVGVVLLLDLCRELEVDRRPAVPTLSVVRVAFSFLVVFASLRLIFEWRIYEESRQLVSASEPGDCLVARRRWHCARRTLGRVWAAPVPAASQAARLPSHLRMCGGLRVGHGLDPLCIASGLAVADPTGSGRAILGRFGLPPLIDAGSLPAAAADSSGRRRPISPADVGHAFGRHRAALRFFGSRPGRLAGVVGVGLELESCRRKPGVAVRRAARAGGRKNLRTPCAARIARMSLDATLRERGDVAHVPGDQCGGFLRLLCRSHRIDESAFLG